LNLTVSRVGMGDGMLDYFVAIVEDISARIRPRNCCGARPTFSTSRTHLEDASWFRFGVAGDRIPTCLALTSRSRR
jgi:hypothetical protein